MIRLVTKLVLILLIIISCNNKKDSTVVNEQHNTNALPNIEQGTLNLGDTTEIKQSLKEYNKASAEIDSLWNELAGNPKPSERKKFDFKEISKKLLDTLSSIQDVINSDDEGYIVNIDEQLYKKKLEMDNGESQNLFGEIKLATEKLREDATIEAIKNLQKQFKIPDNTMLIEQFKDQAGKQADDVFILGLITANKEQATTILVSYFDMKPKEIELMAKIPNSKNITTYKKAKQLPKDGLTKEVTEYLNKQNNTVSSNFRKKINSHKRRTIYNRDDFLRKSNTVKAEFIKLNPTWYSDKQAEDFYLDSRNKLIYLPLGKLSFADRVIHHNTGEKDLGDFTQGCIGEPNVMGQPKYKDFFDGSICNIGIKGDLTVQFIDNVLIDVNGPDLYVFEIGKIEPTLLEISQDGENWINIGKIKGGTAYVDIHDFIKPNQTFNYVRLTDLGTYSGVPGADVDAIATIGGAFRLSLDSEVLFDTGNYTLKKAGKKAIKKLANQIKDLKHGTITVEGHTDNIGKDAYNLKLSKNRAHSVSSELQKNIKNKNFNWKEIGYGKSKPIVKNDSKENRKKNRRVEIMVLPTNK